MDVSGLIYLVCHLVSLRGRLNTLVLNHFQHPPTERSQTVGQERGRASSGVESISRRLTLQGSETGRRHCRLRRSGVAGVIGG